MESGKWLIKDEQTSINFERVCIKNMIRHIYKQMLAYRDDTQVHNPDNLQKLVWKSSLRIHPFRICFIEKTTLLCSHYQMHLSIYKGGHL